MPTSPGGSPPRQRLGSGAVRLTQRGRIALTAVVGVVVLVLAVVVAHAVRGPGGQAAAVSTPASAPASVASPTAATSPVDGTASAGMSTMTATASGSGSPLPAGASTDAAGYVHSNLPASGAFEHSTITIAPRHRTSVVHTYVVEVETSLPGRVAELAPNTVATEVASVLNDPRGWIGMTSGPAKGVSFELVSDPSKAEFVIHLASAQTVNKLCPLDTVQLWSCDAGKTVLLNVDRWLYRTPIYADTAEYRAYMVNHEVGHFIGFGHKTCPGAGKPAPVMMQQSKGLGGCVANAWPTVA